MSHQSRRILIMAGGTGGHIFPGLTLADALRHSGHEVFWLGSDYGLEQELIPKHGIPMDCLHIRGVRGKHWQERWSVPWMVIKAIHKSMRVIKEKRIEAVVGFGGYPSLPGGIAASLLSKPLLIHEQNAISGLSNRLLSYVATKVFAAFPGSALPKQQTIGNPVRADVLKIPEPSLRFSNRSGPLRVLVMGGSLGAQILNHTLPQVFAQLKVSSRPVIRHQCGRGRSDSVQIMYDGFGVKAECIDFIEDVTEAYAWADWVICRAGALTVSELAACGLGAWYIPFPHAVDDHQTLNAQHVTQRGGGVLLPQSTLTVDLLVSRLQHWSRRDCEFASKLAYSCGRRDAVDRLLTACEEI